MAELLASYPGAQRALFARYHIGGCRSCGFQPDETLAQVCARNENLPVNEVAGHIQASHDADQKISITPREFADLRSGNSALKILDVRTREEHEAASIPGSRLVVRERCGHGSRWRLETFHSEIENFLADVEAGRPVAGERRI